MPAATAGDGGNFWITTKKKEKKKRSETELKQKLVRRRVLVFRFFFYFISLVGAATWLYVQLLEYIGCWLLYNLRHFSVVVDGIKNFGQTVSWRCSGTIIHAMLAPAHTQHTAHLTCAFTTIIFSLDFFLCPTSHFSRRRCCSMFIQVEGARLLFACNLASTTWVHLFSVGYRSHAHCAYGERILLALAQYFHSLRPSISSTHHPFKFETLFEFAKRKLLRFGAFFLLAFAICILHSLCFLSVFSLSNFGVRFLLPSPVPAWQRAVS